MESQQPQQQQQQQQPLQQPLQQQQQITPPQNITVNTITAAGTNTTDNIGSLLSQLGNTRTSPFFSLLRLTSQSNLQELLSSSSLTNDMGGLQSNEINELFTQTILSNIGASTPVNKGVLGNATFFETHHRAVKGVDFSPNDDHIFCSAGLDGKCNLYDARFGRLKSSSIISYQGTVNFSGLKFLTGGHKIALSTSSNKLLIFDVEKAAVIQSFDRCCFSGPFKTSIAMDLDNPYILVTPNISGKGLSQIDIRSPHSIKSIDQIHQNTINDIQILNSSWSKYYNNSGSGGSNVNVNSSSGSDNNNIGSSSNNLILTVSSDSTVKIMDSQKNILKQFDFSTSQHCIAHTPEPPESNGSCFAIGGDKLSIYHPDGTLQNIYYIPSSRSIMKACYTHNGTKLFIANNDGNLRLFNKSNLYKHDLDGIVYKHSRDIQDLSISKNDEYLVTASADSKVGLIRIGDPIFGPSECGQIR